MSLLRIIQMTVAALTNSKHGTSMYLWLLEISTFKTIALTVTNRQYVQCRSNLVWHCMFSFFLLKEIFCPNICGLVQGTNRIFVIIFLIFFFEKNIFTRLSPLISNFSSYLKVIVLIWINIQNKLKLRSPCDNVNV